MPVDRIDLQAFFFTPDPDTNYSSYLKLDHLYATSSHYFQKHH